MMVDRISTTFAAGVLLVFAVQCVEFARAENGGRLFALSFLNLSRIASGEVREEIMVSSYKEETEFKVEIPHFSYSKVFLLNLKNNFELRLEFDEDISIPLESVPYTLAVTIAAKSAAISVQVNKAIKGSTAGYFAMPIKTQGVYLFYVPSYKCSSSVLSVISLENDNCMEVNVWAREGGEDVRGLEFTRYVFKTLQKNEVFNMQSGITDYTGVHVQSRKPTAVYGGCDCAAVPAGATECDQIWEQVPTIQQLDQKYVMGSIDGRPLTDGFIYRHIATPFIYYSDYFPKYRETQYDKNDLGSPNIVYQFEDIATDTHYLTRGQWFENATKSADKYTVLTANCQDRCMMMQYNPSRTGTESTDPAMVLVPPVERYTTDIKFGTARVLEGGKLVESQNYLTVFAKSSGDPPKLKFDDADIASVTGWKKWIKLDDSDFSDVYVGFITAPIRDGFHTLTSDTAADRYTGILYGHGKSEHTAWGYPIGYDSGYDKFKDPPGPWYEMSLLGDATTAAPAETTPAAVGTTTPPPDGDDEDVPTYKIIFVATFTTLDPNEGNTIGYRCSNGYGKFFGFRLTQLNKTINELARKWGCSNNVKVSMVLGKENGKERVTFYYYAEYSQHGGKFTVIIEGSGTATLGDIIRCAATLEEKIRDPSEWLKEKFKKPYATFLKQVLFKLSDDDDEEEYNTEGCSVMYVLEGIFKVYAKGFGCPQKTGAVFGGAALPPCLTTSVSALAVAVSFLLQLVLGRWP